MARLPCARTRGTRSRKLKEDQPWEKLINSYPNMFYDEDELVYKMWHGCQAYCPRVDFGTHVAAWLSEL